MSRSPVGLSLVGLLAALSVAEASRAEVYITRKPNGSVMMWNDEGSGWKPSGKAPTDGWLVSRRNAPSPWDEVIRVYARKEGVDFALAKSVMLIESAYNPAAVSRKGARGLMQLMPFTAQRYGVRNVHDPAENIRAGVQHLADLLQMFQGDVRLSLAAYNAGAKAVLKYSGVPPYAETQEYVRRGMVAYQGRPQLAVLAGGFRGGDFLEPVKFQRVSELLTGPPVKIHTGSDGLALSNAGAPARVAPVLGRVAP